MNNINYYNIKLPKKRVFHKLLKGTFKKRHSTNKFGSETIKIENRGLRCFISLDSQMLNRTS